MPEGRQARGTPGQRDAKGTLEERDASGMPEGREGIHPTQYALFHTYNAKAARHAKGTPQRRQRDTAGTPEGRQRDARPYIRPLSGAHCPTPATQKERCEVGECVRERVK